MNAPITRCLFAMFASASLLVCTHADAATIKLNPQATYLLQSSSDTPSISTTPIVLADAGVSAGDLLLLEILGDYTFRLPVNEAESGSQTIAVFSSSATILGSSLLERIPDAIDAGADFDTANTFHPQPSGIATNIPEDFAIPGSLQIVVPAGATHLFVAAADTHYSDNSDVDNGGLGDYAVRLTVLPVVPLPAAVWGGLALCGIIAVRRAIRARKPLP